MIGAFDLEAVVILLAFSDRQTKKTVVWVQDVAVNSKTTKADTRFYVFILLHFSMTFQSL